jgi:hypothetical protein
MEDKNFTINNNRIVIPICVHCTEGRCPYNFTANIVEDKNLYTRIECDCLTSDKDDEE